VKLPFDFAVIDCPPNVGQLVVNALFAADMVIVPISSPMALQSTYHLFDVMEQMSRRFKKTWQLRGLQTFYRANVRESERLTETLRQEFRGKVFETRINLNTQISLAMAAGRPILDYPHSSGYTDYRKLTDEVLDVTGTQTAEGRRSGGRARLHDATGTDHARD
jgi:chromosome partitioning protein